MNASPPAPASTVAPALGTHAKALAINLDTQIYGTLAEIGAGQEVARWFLTVGAASGTIAQTICAYDKTFSDETYGAGSRYVSRERAVAMLDHEYGLLLNRLSASRGAQSQFFVFADSIATRNFKGDNEQHGWLGLRFQASTGSTPSDILLHVTLREPSQRLQQETIGVLGVNLVYAAFYQRHSMDSFLAGLFDGLTGDRIEIDLIDLSGPAFKGIDSRKWCLGALRRQMCRALTFDQTAKVVEPSAVLRKRPLIVERGKFESPAPYQQGMLDAALKQLRTEPVVAPPSDRDPVCILEMTLNRADGTAPSGDEEVLARVGRVVALGPVIVSGFSKNYLLIHFLQRHTAEPMRMVVGVANLAQILHHSFYVDLPGSVFEGLARMLAANVKLYVYPMPAKLFQDALAGLTAEMTVNSPPNGPVRADDIVPHGPVAHLYRYLRESGIIVPLES